MNEDEMEAFLSAVRDCVRSEVTREVGKAIAALPQAEPGPAGKDADPEWLALEVERVFPAMMHKATAVWMQSLEVARAAMTKDFDARLAALPVPMHPDSIRLLIRDDAQKIIDAIPRPKDGERGEDGLEPTDFSVELKGDRTLVFKLERLDISKTAEITVPWPIDAGPFKADREYAKGDCATCDGSYWIAQTVTKDRPGTSAAWRMAVRKGQDGKDSGARATQRSEPLRIA